MNSYDPYMQNKIVIGNQLILIFHIDNVLMTHLKSSVVTEHMKLLDKKYRNNDPLSVTRGRIYEYLHMTLDFRRKESVVFTQYNTIKKFWNSLILELKSNYRSIQVPVHLFEIDPNLEKMDVKIKDEYHTATTKYLNFSQRSRIDL